MDIGDKLKIGLFVILITAIYFSIKNQDKPLVAMNHETQTQKIDSLQNVISNLEGEIIILEDGFDSRERRYEDIIFRYEISLDYLKHNHRTAYNDFIRISQMKEKYDRESEREFEKQTQINF